MNNLSTKILIVLLTVIGFNLYSQVELYPYTSNPKETNKFSSVGRVGITEDTLTLPFSDDFTSLKIEDHWIENRGSFVNNHMAENQPNAGVLTFDGIDGTGTAYHFVTFLSEIDGIGDEITSCPINLSGVSTTDGLAMSFFWQIGSQFNAKQYPEFDNGDALRLQFLDSTGVWRIVWPTSTQINELIAREYPSDTFLLENVLVDPKYMHDAFQFKFQYNGILTGNWDLFSVDNIYLDTGIAVLGADTTFNEPKDYGISHVPQSFLKGYSTMPFSHFVNATAEEVIVDSVRGSVYSLDNLFINDQDSSLKIINNETKSVLYATSSNSFDIGFNQKGDPLFVNWELDKSVLKNALDNLIFTDSVFIQSTIELNTPDTIQTTDSASSYAQFNNYYARDDGSIEAGAAFIGPGEMVMAFDILEADVLTGLQVYFPKMGENFEGTFITFKLYSSLEGIDGATETKLEYSQSDVVAYSKDSIVTNQFISIPFSEKQFVNAGKYYIGYESLTNAKILIGVDLNNNYKDEIFFRLFDDPWASANVAGALAIRPVVESLQVAVYNKEVEEKVLFYPNPARDQILLTENVEEYFLYNLSGELVKEGTPEGNKITVSDLTTGMYILETKHEEVNLRSKLIIE